MTVRELIERLEGYDPNTPVVLVYQPNYPLKGSIGTVVSQAEIDAHSLLEGRDEESESDEYGEAVVYIGEGSCLGYGPRLG